MNTKIMICMILSLILISFNNAELINSHTFTFDGNNGDSPDDSLWEIVDGDVQINNDKVRVTQSGTTQSSIWSKFQLSGDFDVSVDFDSIVLPNANGAVGVFSLVDSQSYNTWCQIGHGFSQYRYYFTGYTGTSSKYFATSDMSGKLRITRTGSSSTMYKWNGSGWDSLSSGYAGTDDMYIRLGAGSWAANPALTIDFDNLTMNYNESVNLNAVVPEVNSIFLCMLALLTMLNLKQKI